MSIDLLVILKIILITEASAADQVGLNGERTRYQISPIALLEVNEHLYGFKKTSYITFEDMQDELVARYVARTYLEILRDKYHCDTVEKLVKGWNGGPKGYLKKSTYNYWIRFQYNAKKEGYIRLTKTQ